ncbi:hypothetical protein [Serratia plymuthica]|nr:hypothetical protein [Serratia plymuthica]ANJ91729.1 membrane protein [Serratia plymuthica]ANJ98108.1 membrane protein [Serratia plymuthica]EKF65393.1 putative membrane protein [Serratia plymuthica A30]
MMGIDLNSKTRFLSVMVLLALVVIALDLGIADLVHSILIG